MPFYQYKAIDSAGKPTKGGVAAENQTALRQALKAKGQFLTEATVSHAGGKAVSGKGDIDFKRLLQFVGLRDIALVTRQLATLLRAGIPLVESLKALEEQADKDELKRVLENVKQKVNEGSSLAAALEAHPKRFNSLYIHMVRAGESSGNLDVVLERLTDFLESQMELRAKIVGAMIYPIVMTVVGGGILTFLFSFVVPKITQMFEDQEKALPFITEMLLFISAAISGWSGIFLFVFITGSIVSFFFWKRTPQGKAKWDRFILKVPVVSGVIRMIAISRFARTLGTLLSSGVPLLQALDIVKNILGNTRLEEVIDDVRRDVREGETIAKPLKASGEFPPLVTHMVAIGERTGQLEEMLDNIAINYKQQVDVRVQAATSLLEPLLIVGMGIAVAFIVFAIMLPIIEMNNV